MLAMVAVVIAARLVADRVNLPYTIVLTICGLIYAVLPGPNLRLEPHLVLVLIIPPLLYSAARRSSLLAIRANWRPIASNWPTKGNRAANCWPRCKSDSSNCKPNAKPPAEQSRRHPLPSFARIR